MQTLKWFIYSVDDTAIIKLLWCQPQRSNYAILGKQQDPRNSTFSKYSKYKAWKYYEHLVYLNSGMME